MSQKTISLIVALFIISILTACTYEESDGSLAGFSPECPQSGQAENFCECISNVGELPQTDKHFRVIQPVDMPSWYSRYEILNSYGNIVYCFTTSASVWIEYINENVLEIGWGAGTGVQIVRFYSIENDIFSDVFVSPSLIKNEVIAYIAVSSDNCFMLVVRNIFDTEAYHKIFYFEDFAPTMRPSSSTYAIYLGDNQIRLLYLQDANSFDTSVVLQLDK